MKENLNPQKYVELIHKLQEEAKAAAIALLKDHLNGQLVIPSDSDSDWEDDPFDSNMDYTLPVHIAYNGYFLQLHAFGVNKDGDLCFKAWRPNDDTCYEKDKWCNCDEHHLNEYYHLIYDTIARYILNRKQASGASQ